MLNTSEMGSLTSKPKKSLDETLSELESALDKHNAVVSAAWGLPVMAKPMQQEVDELVEEITKKELVRIAAMFPSVPK